MVRAIVGFMTPTATIPTKTPTKSSGCHRPGRTVLAHEIPIVHCFRLVFELSWTALAPLETRFWLGRQDSFDCTNSLFYNAKYCTSRSRYQQKYQQIVGMSWHDLGHRDRAKSPASVQLLDRQLVSDRRNDRKKNALPRLPAPARSKPSLNSAQRGPHGLLQPRDVPT